MGQIQLNKISKEIIDHVEQGVVPEQGLPKVVDDYIVQRLKEDEMQHAEVDARMYEGLRKMVQSEVLPLYAKYRMETAHVRERSQSRRLWHYVLGTVGAFEILEALLTKGRAFAPGVLLPSAILYSFLGFIVYTGAQYVDRIYLARARKRLESAIGALEGRLQTDMDYDHRRRLMDTDILRAEAVEILAHYEKPNEFWRDYLRVREADPASLAEAKALALPAFDRFLKFHLDGQYSELSRMHRFDRLFIEAHEIFLSRDHVHYAVNHLKNRTTEL